MITPLINLTLLQRELASAEALARIRTDDNARLLYQIPAGGVAFVQATDGSLDQPEPMRRPTHIRLSQTSKHELFQNNKTRLQNCSEAIVLGSECERLILADEATSPKNDWRTWTAWRVHVAPIKAAVEGEVIYLRTELEPVISWDDIWLPVQDLAKHAGQRQCSQMLEAQKNWLSQTSILELAEDMLKRAQFEDLARAIQWLRISGLLVRGRDERWPENNTVVAQLMKLQMSSGEMAGSAAHLLRPSDAKSPGRPRKTLSNKP